MLCAGGLKPDILKHGGSFTVYSVAGVECCFVLKEIIPRLLCTLMHIQFHGATAIWEAWDADDAKRTGRFVSFNHYAFGCVDDFIFRHIAGIDSEEPGFSHIVIRPDPDCGLAFCDRKFECEAGTIAVHWNREKLEVSIPCNTDATVYWKGKEHEIGSGSYVL